MAAPDSPCSPSQTFQRLRGFVINPCGSRRGVSGAGRGRDQGRRGLPPPPPTPLLPDGSPSSGAAPLALGNRLGPAPRGPAGACPFKWRPRPRRAPR